MSARDPSQHKSGPIAANKLGRLFIVSAPSGAGKTTLCQAVRKRMPDLHYSISYTTRPRRDDELDGVHYRFISESEFRKGIQRGRWAEWASVHGNLYGTDAADLNRILEAGGDILLDIDVQGARQLIRRYPHSVTIFILPPSFEILEQRLAARATDNEAAVALRLQNAKAEIAAKDEYGHVLVNDDLDGAVAELEAVISGYRTEQ